MSVQGVCLVAATAGGVTKRRKTTDEAYKELKQYGDLCRLVRRRGRLPKRVKTLLKQLPSSQLKQYFSAQERGHRLLSQICLTDRIQDVYYLARKLRLYNLPPVDHTSSNRKYVCPLLAALNVSEPRPDVVLCLIEHGYRVTKAAFRLWATRHCNPERLRLLLKPLIDSSQSEMPSTSELIDYVLEGLRESTMVYSKHIDLLLLFVTFTADDMRKAAHLGYITIVDQMCFGNDLIDKQQLAEIFELCEVSRYYSVCGFTGKLSYFRKSLRTTPRRCRASKDSISYREWTLFKSEADIDRLEAQIAQGNFLETTWQMLLAGAKRGVSMELLSARFFARLRGIINFSDVVDMATFIVCSNAYVEPTDLKRREAAVSQFSTDFFWYCSRSIAAMKRPLLSDLPAWYYCLRHALSLKPQDSWAIKQVSSVLSKMDIDSVRGQIQRNRRWLDETIFLFAIEFDRYKRESAIPIIFELLKWGASIMVPQGHDQSTLYFLLKNAAILPKPVLKQIASQLCCPLDTSPAQCAALGFRGPSPLRCLAAVASRRFSQVTLLQNIPRTLVWTTLKHPPKVSS